MTERHLFTSESVSMGHPDKIADQISDAVLDAMLAQDSESRVACETMITTGMVVIAGEVTTKASVDIAAVARETIRNIGYTDSAMGFDADTCAVIVSLDKQSPDISQGVTAGEGLHKEQGAGDQGIMFGFACNETPQKMPMAIQYSHKLVAEMAKVRKNGKLKYLRPDSKSQVTIEYENGKPKRVDTVVISTQHAENVSLAKIRKDIIANVIKKVIPEKMLDKKTIFHVNPTGRFVIGGPMGDCGLTGRKIIVDTYGGMGRHGGGAFSGKDPSKVDRSAAYMARYIAKNVVAAKLAEKCEVQLSYAIGVAEPTSVLVDTFGTGKVEDAEITAAVRKVFKLTPTGILTTLQLKRPIFKQTAAHGHFGRTGKDFTWEQTDKAAELKKAIASK